MQYESNAYKQYASLCMLAGCVQIVSKIMNYAHTHASKCLHVICILSHARNPAKYCYTHASKRLHAK